ncbi:TonB-dependent receptor [Sphingosinicella sp. LHD-64]|uniref:TonB-dependent receptor n=1 Tax=Sphingosinicella sp. LHD-64 TaxID=3072139 RepID=UPI00280C475D|nr:TonB-dependent receptor [Sphingosinicella sp. LHD-64]MDQ8755974.1 TonB-dependent receptor [Sphingosinicella sp. LHD-64]
MTARFLALIPLFAATPAVAQSEIVVTGRGLEEPRTDAVYDVVTIGRERLAHSASNRLEDVLRDVPGFQQFRRSDSRTANPTSQGATLRALGGNASSRALLILDGVPQTDPFGGWIAWPAYDPRRLGRIRVVRGGGSGTAGPGALAGSIEMDSAGPDDAAGLAAGLAYGSRDGVDAYAGYGARLGTGFFTVSAAYAHGDGFVPIVAEQRGPADRPSPYEQASIGLRAVAAVSAGTELQANVSAFTDRRERGTAFSAIRNAGADASLRLVGHGDLPFSLLAYVQVRDFANQFAAVSAGRTAAALTLDQYSVPATGLGARAEVRPRFGEVELRLGADWRDTEGRTQELFQFVAGAPTRGRVAGGRTRTLGAFAEASWEHGPVTLTAGGRIDRWRILDGTLRERILATQAPLTDTTFPDRAGWEPTGRAGAAWRIAAPLTLRAAAYRGWRLPTLNELYRPFRAGIDATAANAALAPETVEGVEAGIDFVPADNARIGVTFFVNRLEDAIANVTLGRGPGTFPGVGFVQPGGAYRQRQNIDAIVSRGLEIDAGLRLGRWHLAAGYSYADAEVRADGPAAPLDGLRPAQAPRHSASASLSWEGPRGAYASLGLRYAGSQYEDDLNAQRIPDALTVDAVGVLPLTRALAVEARAENLTDARVVAGISGAGIIERGTPRTLWLGLRWRG